MSISLSSNIAVLRAQRQLALGLQAQGMSSLRLSSGLRINTAADDAAGLALSSTINSRARVYGQAIRNANDGISALAIAEGATGQLTDILVRLKELAEGASNGTYSSQQRRSLDSEAHSLTNEFNRIIATTRFNGQDLLTGSLGRLNIQIGYGSSELIGYGLGQGLQHAAGNGSFSPGNATLTSGSGPNSGTSADLNGDGKIDIVVSDGGFRIMIGDGQGGFGVGPTTTLLAPGSAATYESSVVDVNGDGRLDVVGASAGGISVFLGNGNGTFASAIEYTAPQGIASATGIVTGDFNGDSQLDIAASTSTGLKVLLGNGNGTFQNATAYSTSLSLSSVKIGDFNGDGVLDLLASEAANIQIFRGSTDGTFQLQTSMGSKGGNVIDFEVGDLNHDGFMDVVLVNASTSTEVSLGNGNFNFKPRVNYSLGSGPGGVSLADLNSDGYLDIVAGTGSLGIPTITSLLGVGDGTFGSRIDSDAGSDGFSLAPNLAMGDFNGDGVPDVAMFDQILFDGVVQTVLSNTSQVSTVARLDLTTQSAARNSLTTIDSILQRVGSELGGIGATQSRLASAINTLGQTKENYTAAASRITDVDVAAESANLVRQQILTQSATAVLAQAAMLPDLAIRLLRA